MKNINRLNDVLYRMVSLASLWKHTNARVYRDLDATEAFVAQRERERDVEKKQCGLARNISRIISSFQNFWRFYRLSISVLLFPWAKWGMSVHGVDVSMCVRVSVFMCVIQKQLSVTRASITGRMSAEITAHCLQRNLSVSCKRWRGRRRKSEPGKYFSLWRCNQQCSALRSLK